MKSKYRTLLARLSCEYKIIEPLARHTSFKIGGPADLMLLPRDAAELSAALREIMRAKLALLVLGNGTNMLAGDRGFRGVVIKLSKGFKTLERTRNRLTVNAALSLPRLVTLCMEQNLTGMEWAVGIPGSVGGALVMNAGAYGGQMSDAVVNVRGCLRDGRPLVIPAKDIHFRYRHAEYPDGFVITGCELRLRPGHKLAIKHTMDQWLAKRAQNQPLSLPSAGCIFKNPPNDSARRLIGLAGMRGKKIGGAQVSVKHANFIVNRGGAKARDVLALVKAVQAAVKRECGVTLVPEVRLVGQR